MKLDPKTKLGSLLTAIPSAAAVLKRFDIPVSGNEDKSLHDLCVEHKITFDAFLRGVNELNWNEEYRP